jgi:O-antigen ligase
VNNETIVRRFLGEDKFEWLIVLCCQLIFAGLVASRAMASIGMIALLMLPLLYYGPFSAFKSYLARKELLFLSLFLAIVVFSGIYSADKESWLNWVRVKLPYVALPLAFAPIARLSEKKFTAIISGFVAILSLSALVVLINYLANYQVIAQSIGRGSAIPIPFPHSHISHIRYTLMLAFAFFCCWYLVEQKKTVFNQSEKWLQGLIMLFLFVALHILTVRSSLLALYLGMLVMLLRQIVIRKNYVMGFGLLLLMLIIPYIGVKTIPSWKSKMEYMDYDKNQFLSGNVGTLSDGVRWLSMQGGLTLAKKNIWLGVGAGDLKSEMENFYASAYPQLGESDHKLPHNQLIWTLATTGVIGLDLFMLAFLFPLFVNGHYKNWLFVIFHLILFSSFFTEATLEEQIGTGFYLTLLLVLLNHYKRE